MPLLGQAVDHYPYSVATVGPGESDDKVHADVLPWYLRDRKRLEESIGGVSGRPTTSACIAISYELVDVAAHGIPVIVSLEEFKGLSTAGMPEGWGIVVALYEVES